MRVIDTSSFRYDVLNKLSAQVDDLEGLRIALSNRRRILVTPFDQVDKDGKCRGDGITEEDTLILGPIDVVSEGAVELEKAAIKGIEKYMKNSPWAAWLADPKSKGVGAKQLARLLGATGDPYWHVAANRPRIVSELWSYSGYGVIDGAAPRRRKGAKANWSQDARKRAWLIAGSCVKSGGPYRAVYDRTKAHYDGAIHMVECPRCTPEGQPPAEIGTPLKLSHIHTRGLRAIAKQLLKDLWIESKRQHEAGETAPPRVRVAT